MGEKMVVDLNEEISKMRSLIDAYSKKVQNNNIAERDYREMISMESRKYVNELQKQLNIYRDKGMVLMQNNNDCMNAIKSSVQHQKTTQESISNAYNELKPLSEHLAFLEENINESNQRNKEQIDSLNNEHDEKVKDLEFKCKNLQKELDIVQQQQRSAQSEKIANIAQIEVNLE